MKKSLILFSIFILFFSFPLYSFAESVSFEDWETGQKFYYDVNTFDEIFSVFEDLNVEYEDLMEEYNSLERDYKDLYYELEEKENEIKELQTESQAQVSLGSKDDLNQFFKIIIPIVIIYIIIFLIRKFKRREN